MTAAEAVVLRAVAYGEADRIVTLFTREHGRLSALARSARSSKKRFGSALELFTVSRVELGDRRRGDLWTLRSAQVVTSHVSLALDVGTLAHASYATELVREMTPAEHPEPDVFDLLVELFSALAEVGASVMVLRAFELHLLDALGLAPVLDACAACGRGDRLERGAIIDPSRGGVLCADCAPHARGAGVRPLTADAREVLVRARGASSLVEAHAVDPGPAAAEARDAMLSIVLDHVGKPLRSLEFIAKVTGAGRARHPDPWYAFRMVGKRLGALALAAVVVSAAAPAAADEKSDAEALLKQGDKLIAKGDTARGKGDKYAKRGPRYESRAQKYFDEAAESYERALAAYEKAYDLVPNVLIFIPISEAELRLGRYLDAIAHYQQVKAEVGDIPGELGEKALAVFEEAKGFIGVLKPVVIPDGAALGIDGIDYGTTPLSEEYLYLQPGDHVIAITAEGYVPFEATVTLDAGAESERTFELEPIPVVVKKPAKRKKKKKKLEPLPPVSRTVLIASGSTSLGLATIGTITGLMAVSKHGTFTNEGLSADERDSARSSGKSLALVTDLMFVGAIAVGAYTAYHYYKVYKPAVAERDQKTRNRVAPPDADDDDDDDDDDDVVDDGAGDDDTRDDGRGDDDGGDDGDDGDDDGDDRDDGDDGDDGDDENPFDDENPLGSNDYPKWRIAPFVTQDGGGFAVFGWF